MHVSRVRCSTCVLMKRIWFRPGRSFTCCSRSVVETTSIRYWNINTHADGLYVLSVGHNFSPPRHDHNTLVPGRGRDGVLGVELPVLPSGKIKKKKHLTDCMSNTNRFDFAVITRHCSTRRCSVVYFLKYEIFKNHLFGKTVEAIKHWIVIYVNSYTCLHNIFSSVVNNII